MVRELIDYLPPFVQGYREIKIIMDAEQITAETTWTDAKKVLLDQFVQDATENGVSRYEKIMKIVPKGNSTLDERKFNILARMNEQLPFTLQQLHNSLTALCGKGGYALQLDTDAYIITIKLALFNENNIEAVEALLHKMLPANIKCIIKLFNTHGILKMHTHNQMGAYTHKEVREAVL